MSEAATAAQEPAPRGAELPLVGRLAIDQYDDHGQSLIHAYVKDLRPKNPHELGHWIGKAVRVAAKAYTDTGVCQAEAERVVGAIISGLLHELREPTPESSITKAS